MKMSEPNNTEMNSDLGEEIASDTKLIANAIGGWQGILDTSLATTVFLVAYVVTGSNLRSSIIAAVTAGLVLTVVRLVQRRTLQQVLSGFLGVALSAWFASRTGKSENFFLLGIIQNAAYFAACLLSLLVRRPLIGYMIESFKGANADWKSVHTKGHKYAAATWIWVVIFGLRLAITVPLYLAEKTAWLATAKLILGTPLYALGVYITYLVVRAPKDLEKSP